MKQTPLVLLTAFAATAFALAACAGQDAPPPTTAEPSGIPFRIDGTLSFVRDGETLHTIDLEIADEDSSRQRGMMQRTSFRENTGMLFVFDTEEMQGFWMANTPLALDLIWVRSDSTISSMSKYVQPMSPETVASTEPIQYVLEVPAGFADTHGIIEGDLVKWQRN